MVDRAIRNKAKKARTRMLLLEAARKAFTELGFEYTKITDITQTAGVSVGTFYEYYENKDAIFLEIVREVNKTLRSDIASFGGHWSKGIGLKERIREAVGTVFDFFDASPYCIPIVSMGGNSGVPAMNQAYSILLEDIIEALLSYARAGVEQHELRDLDTRITIMAIIGAFSGVATLYAKGDFPRDRMVNTLTDFIADGILNPDAG